MKLMKAMRAAIVAALFCTSLSEAASIPDAVATALERIHKDYVSNTMHIYTKDEMNTYVEEELVDSVVRVRDNCQFTPDIEDRARLAQMPVFEYVWGMMLIDGICVKHDVDLGLDFVQKSMGHGYDNAIYKLGELYERGKVVPTDKGKALRLYRLAAEMGNRRAVLEYANLFLELNKDPAAQQVVEAYVWLSSTVFHDTYQKYKQDYLLRRLQTFIPHNLH